VRERRTTINRPSLGISRLQRGSARIRLPGDEPARRKRERMKDGDPLGGPLLQRLVGSLRSSGSQR
jgi:hypothetical protein